MIVVLGPADLAHAVVAAHVGELIVGAGDDERLSGPLEEAAEIAAVLPLPARICVIAAEGAGGGAVASVRDAGGALKQARILFVGDPPGSHTPSTWLTLVTRQGATAVADMRELISALGDEGDGAATEAEERAMRPGAPENAAWREALLAARPRRLRLRRRRKPLDRRPDRELDAIIRRPLDSRCTIISVISPKGGVGKTTLSFLLGSVLARVRGDRVLAVDTNPDFGTLADLVGERVPATISDLLRDIRFVRSDDDLAGYVTVTRTGMHLLAAPQDPVEMSRLGSGGYRAIDALIRRFYDVVVYDCGTGFLDDITQFALRGADHVVLVTAGQLVSTKIVLQALDRLATTSDASHATLAVNMLRSGDSLDVRRLRDVLGDRVGGIVEVPYDARMQREMDLGDFSYARMQPATRAAIRRLAAAVIERLASADLDDDARDGGGHVPTFETVGAAAAAVAPARDGDASRQDGAAAAGSDHAAAAVVALPR